MNRVFVFVITLVAVGVFIGLLIFIKGCQFNAFKAKMASQTPPPETVTSIVVEEEEWTPSLKAIGSTVAVQGVMVSTDLAGIVTKINFQSGQSVKEGDLLVQLDINQELAQLRSAEAQQKLSALNLERQQNLLKSRVSAQSELDAAQAQYDQTTARVEEVKALIDKKTITAPFSGVLGIRLVNLGQYLESGAKVAPLQSLNPIYVNFWLPQQELARIAAGQSVNVVADGLPGVEFSGKINAVDAVVDEATRNVQVQATLPNPDGKLRPGMFVNVAVPLPVQTETIAVPATAVQYAPYGDSVFVIEDMKDPKGNSYRGVRQQLVKLGESRGDRVAILSGVKAGDEVVTSGGFKLKAGAPVHVNNTVQPGNENLPKPDDT